MRVIEPLKDFRNLQDMTLPWSENFEHLVKQATQTKEDQSYLHYLEKLWMKYSAYAPTDFAEHLVKDGGKLDSLTWEMMLSTELLDKGFNLIKAKTNNQPDICIDLGINRLWIECTLATRGSPDAPDSVAPNPYDDEFHEIDIEKNLLRCTSLLNSKRTQYTKWKEDGIINSNDFFIIALNGKELQLGIHHQSLPDILGALYGVGAQYMVFCKETQTAREGGYLHRHHLSKENQAQIEATFFLQPESEFIDGVLYSNEWIMKYSSAPKRCFIRNTKSKNNLCHIFAEICQTYEYTDDTISMNEPR